MNEKKAVAISSMAASALMTVGKLVVGLMTGSLGLLSEALHSFLDFGATVMTFMAVRVSDRPADATHPYGHAKIESITALAETGLLFLTSFLVVIEAGRRLISGHIEVEATWWSVGVVVASILIDLSRARALKRIAEKTKSQALAADALHFSSDVLSSTVVLVGLCCVAAGWPMGDPLAAIGVAIFVCRAGWHLGRSTVDVLVDAAPRGVADRATEILQRIHGVAGVGRVRVRPAGSVLFIDADVSVARTLAATQIEELRGRLEAALRAEWSEAESTLVMRPVAMDSETVQQKVAAIAGGCGVEVHHVASFETDGLLSVSFDIEVDAGLSLAEAHRLASEVESAVRQAFGPGTEVESHIDPKQNRRITGRAADAERHREIESLLAKGIAEAAGLKDPHEIRVRETSAGLVVAFHCVAAPDRTVAEVHDEVDRLERKLQEADPAIAHIVTHVEPEER